MNVPSYSSQDAPVPEGQVVIERSITPLDLGPKFNRTVADVVKFMMQQGEMVTATQSLSDDLITKFAEDLGAEIKLVDPGEVIVGQGEGCDAEPGARLVLDTPGLQAAREHVVGDPEQPSAWFAPLGRESTAARQRPDERLGRQVGGDLDV